MDVGSAVDFTYKLPFAFTGQDREGDDRAGGTGHWHKERTRRRSRRSGTLMQVIVP